MTCQACLHYLPSVHDSNRAAGLVGYGYCKAAPSLELRARFFPESTARCWLADDRFKAAPK